MALTERPEITFSPDRPTPIILGQNAVSPNDPVSFQFFSHPMPLGVKTGALPYTYNDLIYECPPECS